MAGLDPLWWLNHLHFYDLARDGQKRPFVFTRWGGLGGHRYPIGFSGDSVVSWNSLAFSPTLRRRQPTSALAGGATTSAATCGELRTRSCTPAGCSLGFSAPSSGCTAQEPVPRAPAMGLRCRGVSDHAGRDATAACFDPLPVSMAWRALRRTAPSSCPCTPSIRMRRKHTPARINTCSAAN